MRKGVVLSALLHAGVLIATVISWPRALDVAPDETPPNIPIELVTVAEMNNVAPTVTEPEPTQPEPVAEALPEPPPPESVPEPTPPEPEPGPEPPPPEVAPPPPPEPQVAESRAPVRPALTRPRPQAEQPRQNFDLDSVIALLDKRTPAPPPPNATVATQATAGIGARNAMTLDIEAALKTQMRECWNFPAGAPNPEQLIVQVRILLAHDGNLLQASLTPESLAGARTNPYLRSASEAAIRAVYICAPYRNLPTDRYDSWREIVMTFDPKELAGR